jgi:hypothetical protein
MLFQIYLMAMTYREEYERELISVARLWRIRMARPTARSFVRSVVRSFVRGSRQSFFGIAAAAAATATTAEQQSSETGENTAGGLRVKSESFTYDAIKREVDVFFKTAIAAAEKHFAPEWMGPLLHFAAAGEKDTAVPFCKWLVDGKTEGHGTISSKIHQTDIDLDDMIKTFSEQSHGHGHTRENIREMIESHIKCWDSVVAISNGEDPWGAATATAALRVYAKERILPLASSTHRVEAMVRECSHVAATDRGEDARSHYIFLRSALNSAINDIAAKDREDRPLRANGSMGPGLQGQREVRSAESQRKHGGIVKDGIKVRKRPLILY